MNNPVFMTINGTTQGPITKGAFSSQSVGNIYQEGHLDEVLIKAFQHSITIPRDSQTGQPSGQRTHNPFVITKLFDKSSPLIYTALTTGETMDKVELKWYRTSLKGKQEHYYTMVLDDAVIVDIESSMSTDHGTVNELTPYEKVSFTYRKITWTHETASTSGSDDLRSGHK